MSGFLIRARYWRIYYCEEMEKEFPYNLKKADEVSEFLPYKKKISSIY